MFRFCTSLKRVDLYNVTAPKFTDLGVAFGGCDSLTSIDLSYFYAPKL